MKLSDHTFRAMGAQIRVIVGGPAPGLPDPEAAIADAERFVRDCEARLSRFRPDSELTALNADQREAVPASVLLRDAVRAGLWAARRTDGLLDPTLVGEIEAAGYAGSLEGIEPAPLREALAFAPARRPAAPSAAARWREIDVDEAAGVIRRPPGVRFDSGGTGKGLAADLLAERLAGYGRFVVDCGGDLHVGGTLAEADPIEIMVEHPLTGEHHYSLTLAEGGVATSGLDVRVWRRPDGRFAHHLLDPATGEPAWTGLLGVTALGATALEAETLSKAALLSGPDGARQLLGPTGGLLVHDFGPAELVGPIPARPRYSITVPGQFAARVAA
jgi:FAD:protein FMN transferase